MTIPAPGVHWERNTGNFEYAKAGQHIIDMVVLIALGEVIGPITNKARSKYQLATYGRRVSIAGAKRAALRLVDLARRA